MLKTRVNVSYTSSTYTVTKAEAVQKVQTPSSSALLQWQAAGEKLAIALSAYLQSCIFLDTLSDAPKEDATKISSQVDKSLDGFHPKLFNELSRSQVVLAKMRNRISSRAYLLPNEILAEVFKQVVYTPGPADDPFPSMTDGLKRMFGRLHCVLAVCSTWRNTGIEFSELWSVIPVADSKSSYPSPKASLLALERSRALTSNRRHLHLAVVLSDSYYGQSIPLIKKEMPSFASINLETRIENFAYSISIFLGDLLESQSPSLVSELSIHHYVDPLEEPPPRRPRERDYLDHYMSPQRRNHFTQIIGSLSAFRIRGIDIQWSAIMFSNKLVEMHLQSVVLGDDSELMEFLHVLESAPELHNLRLVSVISFSNAVEPINASSSKISIPKLQSLLLDDLPYNVLKIVLTFIAPGTYRIKVHPTSKSKYAQMGDGESRWHGYGSVTNLMSRSNIDTLLLTPGDDESDEDWSLWVVAEELTDKLKPLTNLKTLIMKSWKWDLGAILALDNSHGRLPNLTGLYILGGYITDAELLPQVVASHSLQTLVLDSQSACTDGCDGDSLVQSLREMVPDFRLVSGLTGMDEFNYCSWRLW